MPQPLLEAGVHRVGANPNPFLDWRDQHLEMICATTSGMQFDTCAAETSICRIFFIAASPTRLHQMQVLAPVISPIYDNNISAGNDSSSATMVYATAIPVQELLENKLLSQTTFLRLDACPVNPGKPPSLPQSSLQEKTGRCVASSVCTPST